MARYRATMRGSRGPASRQGSAQSGIEADISGWNTGVKVLGEPEAGDQDDFTVYVTGGSSGAIQTRAIARITEVPDGSRVVTFFGADGRKVAWFRLP